MTHVRKLHIRGPLKNLYCVVRRFWWRHIIRWDSELCDDCGRKQEIIWTAPDWMWGQAMGKYGGVLCPRCFDIRMGHPCAVFIRWVPEVEA